VQVLADVAELVDQPGLDRQVDVLVLVAGAPASGAQLLADRLQPVAKLIGLGGRDQTRFAQQRAAGSG